MRADLCIVLGVDQKGEFLAIVGSYLTELDPIPGLREIVGRDQKREIPWAHYSVLKIPKVGTITLSPVEVGPRILSPVGTVT